MSEETSIYLLDLAADLAYAHFDDPSEEHIKTGNQARKMGGPS